MAPDEIPNNTQHEGGRHGAMNRQTYVLLKEDQEEERQQQPTTTSTETTPIRKTFRGTPSGYGSLQNDVGLRGVEEQRMEADEKLPQVQTRTYISRFWILFVASSFCWLHAVLWSTFGPISESMDAAFDNWGPSTVAMIINWGTIMYVIFVCPMAWATQRCGLRVGMVTCATLAAFSCFIRVFTKTTPAFTILCHLSSIILGVAATLVLAAPMLIASDWFPLNERTTALAVMLGASQLGCLGSYLEPLLIRLPSDDVTAEDIQNDVMRLMYTDAVVSGVLLVAVLVYFPAKPPSPPSLSSTSERFHVLSGIKALATNKNFMVMVVSYGVFVGPPVVWLTVINYSLIPLGFHQDSAMWVGLVSVVASSVLPVISGHLNDRFLGHTKLLLVLHMLATTACFYWFLLITYGAIPLSTWQVYVSVVGAISFNYASIPLFFEVGMDFAYPVPEILVAGIITAADNITSFLFLLIFNIPDVGYHWMTYILTSTSSLPILPLLFLKFDNTRANMDKLSS